MIQFHDNFLKFCSALIKKFLILLQLLVDWDNFGIKSNFSKISFFTKMSKSRLSEILKSQNLYRHVQTKIRNICPSFINIIVYFGSINRKMIRVSKEFYTCKYTCWSGQRILIHKPNSIKQDWITSIYERQLQPITVLECVLVLES